MEIQKLEAIRLGVDIIEKISALQVDETIQEILIDEVLKVLELSRPKKRQPRGELQQKVIDTLEELGEATADQIAELAELDQNAVNSTLTRLNKKGVIRRQSLESEDAQNGRGRQAEFVFTIADNFS